jgi:hypothetical protein
LVAVVSGETRIQHKAQTEAIAFFHLLPQLAVVVAVRLPTVTPRFEMAKVVAPVVVVPGKEPLWEEIELLDKEMSVEQVSPIKAVVAEVQQKQVTRVAFKVPAVMDSRAR